MLASAGKLRGSYGTLILAMMPFGPHVAPEGIVVVVVVVGTVVVVVVVGPMVVVVVVPGPVVVVVGGTVVVVGTPGSRSETTSATNASTSASTVAVSPKVGHGVSEPAPYFASSFAKHPFSGAMPPLNLAFALSMQPLSLGETPFDSAFWWHFRSATSLLDRHFFLPAEHLLITMSGNAGSTAETALVTKASTLASSASLSPNVRHGVSDPCGYLASSLTKHPFSGARPPSYFACALVMQSLSVGSTPLVSAVT